MMTIIQHFDHLTASQAAYEAFNQLSNALRAERVPDLPPIPLVERIEHLQNVPSFMGYTVLVVADENSHEFVALAEIAIPKTEENQHLAQFMIQVLPAYRRKGYGRSLLRHVTQLAQENGRHLLITNSYGNVPAGAAFLERLGASRGLETHTNRLDMQNLDRKLLNDWLDKGSRLTEEFELGLWVGRYPEDELADIALLMDVMNQQPHDDLEIEDIQFTPERVREIEESRLVGGTEAWTMYVRDRQTGKLAGYTAVYISPNRPEQLSQGDTGVFPAYRGRGLGRWLKAATLDKVLCERPEVEYVLTGNADSNAPMLKINHQLGFRPYLPQTIWQVELEKVLIYLNGRPNRTKATADKPISFQ